MEISHWWYKVRRKIIHDLVKKYFPNKNNLEILDVGCGTGALMMEVNKYGNVQGIDVSSLAIDFCKSRGIKKVSLGGATNIGHPDNTFDLAFALDVLEHVEDDKGGIREMYRVLKPGGLAIIFVPAFMFMWGENDILCMHYRRYTLRELKNKLTEGGFEIVRSSYFNTFLFGPIALLRVVARLLGIKIKSDLKLGNPFLDYLFYKIFLLESFFLKYFNFPIGVSAMAVCRKNIKT